MIDSLKTGEFIRQARMKKGLSQRDLASRLNITRESVSKWENGHHLPDVSIMELLAAELDVSVNEILNGAFEEKKEPVPEVSKKGKTGWLIAAGAAMFVILTVLFSWRFYVGWDGMAMAFIREDVISYSDKSVTGVIYLLNYDENVKFSTLSSLSLEVTDDQGTVKRILAVSCYRSLSDIITGSHDGSLSKILIYEKNLERQYDYLIYYPGNLSALENYNTLDELQYNVIVKQSSHWQNARGE